MFPRFRFQCFCHIRKKSIGNVREQYAEQVRLTSLQAFCQGVRLIMMFFGTGQNTLTNIRRHIHVSIKDAGYRWLGNIG